MRSRGWLFTVSCSAAVLVSDFSSTFAQALPTLRYDPPANFYRPSNR